MNYQREDLTPKLWDEMMPLFVRHWREIAHYQDIELKPNVEFYETMFKHGCLRVFTVRKDEALVGYSVFFVKPNPHYMGSIQASQDILFLAPEFRKGSVGARFIKWCDEELKSDGVQAVYHHVKTAHNFGPMLERMGYECVDLIYARRLDK